jgi:hypothetical protein
MQFRARRIDAAQIARGDHRSEVVDDEVLAEGDRRRGVSHRDMNRHFSAIHSRSRMSVYASAALRRQSRHRQSSPTQGFVSRAVSSAHQHWSDRPQANSVPQR